MPATALGWGSSAATLGALPLETLFVFVALFVLAIGLSLREMDFSPNPRYLAAQLRKFEQRFAGQLGLTELSCEWSEGRTRHLIRGRAAGREVELDVGSLWHPSVGARARISLRVERPGPTFRVEKASLLRQVGRSLGLVSDPSLGDRMLDDRYVVAGDAEGALRVLSDGPLQALLSRGHVDSLELEGDWLRADLDPGAVAQANSDFYGLDPQRASQMLAELLAVAGRCDRQLVTLTPREGRAREGFALRGTVSGQGRCPYCHEDFALDRDATSEPLEACASCGTLHHEECLTELGRCTVLGCGQRRADPTPA